MDWKLSFDSCKNEIFILFWPELNSLSILAGTKWYFDAGVRNIQSTYRCATLSAIQTRFKNLVFYRFWRRRWLMPTLKMMLWKKNEPNLCYYKRSRSYQACLFIVNLCFVIICKKIHFWYWCAAINHANSLGPQQPSAATSCSCKLAHCTISLFGW